MDGSMLQWTTDQQIDEILAPIGKTETVYFFENRLNGKFLGYANASGRVKELQV